MEVIRHFLDADVLKSIIPLPDSFRNRKLEIIVLPASEEPLARNNKQVREVVQALSGAVPDTGMTLDDYRAERLKKYETSD